MLTINYAFTEECSKLAADVDQNLEHKIDFDSINSNKAIIECKKALNLYPGDPKYLFMLARSYLKNKNYNEALDYFTLAANKKYVLAMRHLGMLYMEDDNKIEFPNKDNSNAVIWFKKAVEYNDPTSLMNLGALYTNHFEKFKEAKDLYEKAINMSYDSTITAQANYNIGILYMYGYGLSADRNKAIEYFQEAAKIGYVDAFHMLGEAFYLEADNFEPDYPLALSWYKKAAINGVIDSQLSLGFMYDEGLGIIEDDKEAFKWYLQAAQNNDPIGAYNIGLAYDLGKGVEENKEKAIVWYKKAALQGDNTSLNNIGHIYDYYYDDSRAAYKWYTKAANKNNYNAQYNLGVLHYDENSEVYNIEKAKFWLKKALNNIENNDGDIFNDISWIFYELLEYDSSLQAIRKAIELNNQTALNNMGEYYEHGKMLEKDFNKAFEYYAKSSSLGSELGSFNVARMHFFGMIDNSDYKQSLRFINAAINLAEDNDSYYLNFYKKLHEIILEKKITYKKYANAIYDLENKFFEGNYSTAIFLANYFEFIAEKTDIKEALKWYYIVKKVEEHTGDTENIYFTGTVDAAISRISSMLNSNNKTFAMKESNLLYSKFFPEFQKYINEERYQLAKNQKIKETIPIITETNNQASIEGDFLNFGNYKALIISNSNYKYLNKIENAINDGNKLKDILENKYNFDVTFLKNATREDIYFAFDNLRELKNTDNLLIYYAGHGIIDRDSKTGYWQPVDARPNRRSQWISVANIKEEIKAIKSNHILVIADSCFSGTLTSRNDVKIINKDEFVRKALVNEYIKKKARLAITSGREDQLVIDKQDEQIFSPFAENIIKVLNSNEDQWLRSSDLFKKIQEKMYINYEQKPTYDAIYGVGGDRNAEFFFVKK